MLDPALLQYATADEIAELDKLLSVEEARQSPLSLACYTSEAERYPHTEYINACLVALVEHRLYKSGIGPVAIQVAKRKWVHPDTGEKALTKLMILCPPRHGKSFIVSHHFPAWWLMHFPNLPIILASYEADFAAEWGAKVRDLIEEHPELGLKIKKDQRSKDNWRLEGHTGGMFTAGSGGPVTGKGAGLLVLDDPIKNAEEAMSQAHRDNSDNWYQSTFRTRGNRKGNQGYFTVAMYTPWHEDDLGGRLRAREGDDWFIVTLPSLAYDTTDEEGFSVDPDTLQRDALNRHPGEALCPDLATEEELQELETSGKQWFTAMYQCKPNIEGGGIFRRSAFRRFRKIDGVYSLHGENEIRHVPESEIVRRYGIADMAATTKTRADYSAIGVFAITRRQEVILEKVYRRKLESPDHESFVRDIYRRHSLSFVGIEDQTYGKSLIQHLIRKGGVVVRKLKADTDKTSRAVTYGPLVDNGQVYIPFDEEWVEPFLDELVKFPNAAHDDQVDMFTYGLREWEKIPTWADKLHPDTSLEARARKHMDDFLNPKKRHYKHVDLY